MLLRTVEMSSFRWDWSSRYRAAIAGPFCDAVGKSEVNFETGRDVGSGAGGRRKEVRICDSVGGIVVEKDKRKGV